MPTIEAVSGRLDVLERENRGLRWVSGGLLLAVVAMGAVAIGGRERGAKTLEAQRLVIRDKEGRIRGSFGVDRAGLPGLKIFDRRGNEQIDIGVPSEDTSSLTFSDRGMVRVLLDTSIEGMTTLRLFDQARMMQSALVIKPDGAAELSMGHGDRALTLSFPRDGRPLVTDARGRMVDFPIAGPTRASSEWPVERATPLTDNILRGPRPDTHVGRSAGLPEGRTAAQGLAN